ncbi:concanavalin A-like lectin/glucanase domain-containing protein [Glomus cerebriforme]|uniref:Concanavalin A-like lectin/glucanase domain-containing protein n=1 Tax=Glomus cerebriforme TaxID=658196 RepID=A0A397SLM9_9GLOM|nr:concanavalin A-like lectin/glucanase domain-containing protein [Glomus cerebriforme]
MAIFHKEIINNYEKLYETKEGYDVIIYAGEKPNIKEFHAHSLILKTQSKYFKTAFTEDIQKKDGYFILYTRNSSDMFEILLSYMYCGSIDLTKLQSREILNLLITLDEFEFQPLTKYIQETLVGENHHDFIIKNILEIIELTYQKKSLDKLWNICLQQICHNPDFLFKSPKFLTFNPSILGIILKRDDLYVNNEIIIWENLLKWACGQNPVIQRDINKWNKNEITMMERRLSKFIQIIRFYYISSEDFLLKVYPFKDILPNNLINNILVYHMAPSMKPNIDIQPQRFAYGYVWDESACGSKLIIEDNGKVVRASDNCSVLQSVRSRIAFEDKGIFEWNVIIEKICSWTHVGVCSSENFNYENFAGHQSTGWVLSSGGYLYNSKNYRGNYCPQFGDGARVTVHVDMNKRTCAFTVNGIKYPEVQEWNNLPSKLYPVVSLKYPGRLRIQP